MPKRTVVIEEPAPKSPFGSIMAIAGVALSGFWLLNFTAGIIEIPDMLPLVGNIDEAAASAILFSSLRYLGFDILPFGARNRSRTAAYDVNAEEVKKDRT